MMNDRFESLESGEVISVQHDTLVLGGHRTFRVGELNEAIESHLKQAIENWTEENNAIFTDRGLDCEALRFSSKGWQKGRIRLCLEFCPDEPSLPAHSTSSSSLPTGAHAPTEIPNIAPPPPPAMSAIPPIAHNDDRVNMVTSDDPVRSQSSPDPLAMALPLAGMTAMGTMAAAAIATPIAATTPVIPHFTDTTLELEEQFADTSILHDRVNEFEFEFNDNQGVLASSSMMELDLTDLSLDSLDFADQDFLSLEQGLSDRTDEFINLQDIGRSENSGMLIDEVWNELDRGNWTGGGN